MNLYKVVKRLLDIILSVLLIILLCPLFLILALICAADTKAPPIFLQERVGKDSKTFRIIKFRTMKKNAPRSVPAREITHSEEYISHIGNVLRKSGLDELPQLINILKGEMSFVGPRPLMASETRLHRIRKKLGVYNVRPGMTGLAQIKCEYINSAEEKAALDVEYTENMSFLYDLRLIFLTFSRFFKGKHIDEHFSSPSD